jgi:hypothetical protein
MPKSSNRDKFLRFSAEFPFLIYERFSWELEAGGLRASFHFNLANKHSFKPDLFIPRKGWKISDRELEKQLPSLLFHLGLIELISYWKAACPPRVILKAGSLDPRQVEWWKKLYFNGLGEFFYLNSIDPNPETFMEIISEGPVFPKLDLADMDPGALIPVGGGKDSAITLGLLGNEFDILPLVLNPREATKAVIGTSAKDEGRMTKDEGRGTKDEGRATKDEGRRTIEIFRTIDPLLLELNAKGFLNGHTPFSAMLAFNCLVASLLTGRKYIVLSNESSANEATIPGTGINHQYSKSLEFENDFRWYVGEFISPAFEYFSFLRPLNELQIAMLFSRMKSFHPVFRSCNAGSKTDSWCGKCAKCLFTWIILSPFLEQEELERIFWKNLLDDASLETIMLQFTGAAEEKPFDCIGTIEEVNVALCTLAAKLGPEEHPVLLRKYLQTAEYEKYRGHSPESLLSDYMPENLPERFRDVLNKALHA